MSHRVNRVPELGVAIETHAALHSQLRLHAFVNRGVTSEDRLLLRTFERKGKLGRPIATIVIAGRATLRVGCSEHALESGNIVLIPCKAMASMRQEPGYESVVIEWEPRALGNSPTSVELADISESALDDARAIATALRTVTESAHVVPVASQALRLFARCGAPIESRSAAELVESVDPQTERLSKALDHLLSRLDNLPMMVDIDRELDRSPRQLSRVVAAFNRRYGLNSGSWSDTRTRRRVAIATCLMTADGATTERVAELVGYSGPDAFCRALADRGLPTPGNVAREVRMLA